MWIKICGIVNSEDFAAAVDAGADAIGVVVVPSSPRHATMDDLRWLSANLRGNSKVVMVAENQLASDIRHFMDILHPDMIQFHGHEEPHFCESFGLPYIKAIRNSIHMPALIQHTKVFAWMLDIQDENPAKEIPIRSEMPWILAGGLTEKNVTGKIHAFKPWGVDVSRGVEISPRKKDPTKIVEFIYAARAAAAD
jgi:phosphoribosylanthranilate isomerase